MVSKELVLTNAQGFHMRPGIGFLQQLWANTAVM